MRINNPISEFKRGGAIFFTLVVVLVLGMAGAAETQVDNIILKATGDGVIKWTTETAAVGNSSVKMILPTGCGSGNNTEVQIDISKQNLKLKDMNWSYWTLTPQGFESYALPVEFYADINEDGTADKIIAGNILKKSVPKTDEWYQMTPDLWKNYGGGFYVWKEDGTGFNFFVGSDPWAAALNIWGEAKIVRVDLGYGHLGSNEAIIAYVDDLTINGTIYTLEVNTDATLSNLTIDGTTITGFDPNIYTYTYTLPYGTTTIPTVGATPTDPNATIVITQATSLTGGEAERTATVVVTAQDGTTTLTYKVIFGYIKVTMTKTGPATASQGNTITYTITYKNAGLNAAKNVVITETYPPEVEFVSSIPTPDTGTNNQWTIGTLGSGVEGTITVKVRIK